MTPSNLPPSHPIPPQPERQSPAMPWSDGSRASQAAPSARSMFAPHLRMTMALILLNCLALAFCATAGTAATHPSLALRRLLGAGLEPTLIRAGAFAGYLIEAGEYWRLVAALFLHQGIVHLLLNMMALLYFSIWLEPLLGRLRYITLYLLSGVAGNLFSYGISVIAALAGQPEAGLTPSVGASGAVFGLAGALLACEWVAHGSLRSFFASPESRRLTGWILVIVFMGFFIESVDNLAHLGGLMGGFALGFYFFSHLRREPSPTLNAIGLNALYGLIALCVVSLFASTRPVETDDDYNTFVIGRLGAEFGRKDLALAWVNKKMAASREKLPWMRHRAQLLLDTCEYEKAREQVDRVLETSANDPYARYLSGVLYWRRGNLEKAALDLAAASSLEEEAAPAASTSSTTSAISTRAAMPTTRTVSTASTTSTVPTAPAELASQRPQRPRRSIPIAIGPASDEEEPLWVSISQMSYAMVLKRMGQDDESDAVAGDLAERLLAQAEAATSEAARLSRQAPASPFLRAFSSQASQARQSLFRAALLKNHTAWLYAILEMRLDDGLKLVNEAIEVLPEPAFVDTRGWIYFKQGRLREAMSDLVAAANAMDPPSAEICYHIGAVYAAARRRGDAKEYLDKALNMKEDFDGVGEARELLKSLEPPANESPKITNFVHGFPPSIPPIRFAFIAP